MKEGAYKAAISILALGLAASIYVGIQASRIENQISLPSFGYHDLREYGYDVISVSGTLAGMEGGNIANRLNTNEFTCNRATGTCRLAQAEIGSGGFLWVYAETFDIASWDSNFVVFKTQPGSLACAAWTYRIDRIKKELIGIREKANGYDSDRCAGIGLEKFSVKIIDGLDASEKIRKSK